MKPQFSQYKNQPPTEPFQGFSRSVTWGMCQIFYLFIALCFVALILDIHPEFNRANRLVDEQIGEARGAYQSSTCAFYRNELSPSEKERWGKSATAEGKKKCIESEIILNQYPVLMKLRHMAYQYIPWKSGNFMEAVQYLTFIFSTVGPLFVYFLQTPNHYPPQHTNQFHSSSTDPYKIA